MVDEFLNCFGSNFFEHRTEETETNHQRRKSLLVVFRFFDF